MKNKVWKRYHGDKNSAYDPFGYSITKNVFDIDHILPIFKNGTDDIRNLIPMSKKSNQAKDNNLEGTINGKDFEVKEHLKKIGTLYVDDKQVSK